MQLVSLHRHSRMHVHGGEHTVVFDFFSRPNEYPRTREPGHHSSIYWLCEDKDFFRVVAYRREEQGEIHGEKKMGVDVWSWGPRQWRRELYGLIVLRRQGTEDDEEAFPWECCCVLHEQTHSLISCLGRNKHWQLIWRGVSLDLFELHREATEP